MTKSSSRKELHWLEDMLEAIEKIETHERHKDGKDALDQDEHFRVWVLYHLERIGECASRLRQDFDYDDVHPDIDWKGAVGMRRYLVHRYWTIDRDEVWKGILYLPKIRVKLETLIDEKKKL